ncbi:MAG TPA: PHP domain-containing protein [Aggregatilineales bacterium]|nr:PHP domain-containing protein [Anaerolineales bacterium]HRE48115.1 PHP domain-containing protein [Aggregatilineales bacterium]
MTDTLWKVELHSHTLYSADSLNDLETFVRVCRKRGIDRVAVTDHNTIQGALAMARIDPELVIIGEEIMTTQGELLAFFVREEIPPFLSPQETIRRLRDQGAFISVSHPFDRFRRGAWAAENLGAILDQVDALEVFNARCIYAEDNHKTAAFAAAQGKAGTVGSDAHFAYEIGRATLRMMPFEGAGDFALALQTAQHHTRLSPLWVHGVSKFAKRWNKAKGRTYSGGSA